MNGRAAGTRAGTGGLVNTGRSLRLGEGFRGRLDELRIYDRALTAAELRADMAAPTKR